MNIIVVANTKRKALILPHLRGLNYNQHFCADYELPDGWVDQHNIVPNKVGHLRAFRGHQDALAEAVGPALVFEDDAVPISNHWQRIALEAFSHLYRFDFISLHGREFDVNAYSKVADLGFGYGLYTNDKSSGINGCCMAYWITPEAALRFRSVEFDGFPDDLYFWRKFNSAVIFPSPFFHDRSQGSLIDIGATV
jgi:hypothetical protein